jgi:hypothetical protein
VFFSSDQGNGDSNKPFSTNVLVILPTGCIYPVVIVSLQTNKKENSKSKPENSEIPDALVWVICIYIFGDESNFLKKQDSYFAVLQSKR